MSALIPDPDRARVVAQKLLEAYRTTGILGNKEMPEDAMPPGVQIGSEEHQRFITLTVAIDYQRDADQLWAAARQTYADPQTRYLFDPVAVADTGPLKVTEDMKRYRLSRKPDQDARTWQTICMTLTKYFRGQVGELVKHAKGDALRLLEIVRSQRYGRGFPFLKGPKIGPLWIRMLYDNCRLNLSRIHEIPIPVDVHTAQATLQVGAVRTTGWCGPMEKLREVVQRVWYEASKDGTLDAYPLRLDEPLWLLSRNGCRATKQWPCAFRRECPVSAECQSQRVWLTVEGVSGMDRTHACITLRSS